MQKINKKPFKEGFFANKQERMKNKLKKGIYKKKSACKINIVTNKQKAEMPNSWGFSSAGRAPALHAGGQEFESPNLHQLN